MSAPTSEEIERHIAGARDFMKHQPKEATGSCAAVLLHLAAQLEDWKAQAFAWQRNAAGNEARYQRAEAALAEAQGRLAVLERQHAKGPQSEEFP